MSDEETTIENPFTIEKAKTGRAACKKCKAKCDAGVLRMGKVIASPFGSGTMNNWYHVDCLLDSFKTQRATTKSLESVDEITGWEQIGDLERDELLAKFAKVSTFNRASASTSTKKPAAAGAQAASKSTYKADSRDNLFVEFQRICERVAAESSYLGKTAILQKFFLKGCNGKRFEGRLYVWVRMLLPNADKRVYNLQSRQLIKLFARIFDVDASDMMGHLEQGDVSETIRVFFERSASSVKPLKTSRLTLDDVDTFLAKLAQLSKEDEQTDAFRKLCRSATPDDLKMVIRFIKHDIRINSGAKHVLAALSPDAYAAYQSSQNLQEVVDKFGSTIGENVIELGAPKVAKSKAAVQLMSPISPMLAEACKSVERAIEKCPDGMYSEIKYDGERIQLHKCGNDFKFFSRNLKAVPDHKTKRCVEFVPQAFPNASDLILDSEILMVDTQTGEQLPFGTLGKHKKTAFDTAEVCLFVFDCIYLNGEDLTKKPLKERRQILEDNMTPIKNHVQLSEYHLIKKPRELSVMIAKVLQLGLEGLVLKNVNGVYEPGKRHWLKVKKDYLFDGQMADSADLVVLGAWFGSGKKGGILSIYLMGCYDAYARVWKTVTKVHTGLKDVEMDEMHKTLTPLMTRGDPDAPPSWLVCKKSLVPDLVARKPEKMPVWEITGAEFSRSDSHTADGISIRFPRITKQRPDKTWREATTLEELGKLFDASKEGANLQMLSDELNDEVDGIEIKTKIQGANTSPSGKRTSPRVKANDEMKEKKPRLSKKVKSEEVDDDVEDKPPKTQIKREIATKMEVDQKPDVKTKRDSSHDEEEDDTTGDELLSPVGKRAHKINYKFEDSSDDEPPEENEKAAAAVIKATDLHSNTICTERRTSSRKATAQTSPPAATITSAATAVEQQTGNGNDARNSTINIFEGVVLYTPDEVRDRVKEALRYFKLWGGQESTAHRECTHVLHSSDRITQDLMALRDMYEPLARHVYFPWLVESVRDKALAATELYPVTLAGNDA